MNKNGITTRLLIGAGGAIISIICVFLGWVRVSVSAYGYGYGFGYSLFGIAGVSSDIQSYLGGYADGLGVLTFVTVIAVITGLILLAAAAFTLYTCYKEYTGKGKIEIYGFIVSAAISVIFIIINLALNAAIQSLISEALGEYDQYISYLGIEISAGAGPGAGLIITLITGIACLVLLIKFFPAGVSSSQGYQAYQGYQGYQGATSYQGMTYNTFDEQPVGAQAQDMQGQTQSTQPQQSAQPAQPAQQPKFCGHCGAEVEPGTKFCPSCGQQV